MKTTPQTKIVVPMNERPRCVVDGCNRPGQHTGNYRVDGTPMFRATCTMHHTASISESHGGLSMPDIIAQNAGFGNDEEYQLFKAREAGFDNVIDYRNSKHRYRCNRLDYCQNCAGEAVWVDPDTGEHKPLHDVIGLCTYTIPKGDLGLAMLSVDHINGNNNDDRPENHQTLCHNCHKAKSIISKDHWSCEKKRKHRETFLKNSASSLVFG